MPLLTICTLVTDISQYGLAVTSFRRHGFSEANTEFLYIDNTNGNKFDGYSGIREFLFRARGKYVLICHQDIELIDDGFSVLVSRLADLDRLDPLWALAGNAGLNGIGNWALRITDPHSDNAHIGDLPARVSSLDEDLLIVRRASLVTPSADLRGFHFYGLDLCLQAEINGMHAYVIDFHLGHKSQGSKSRGFLDARDALEKKYAIISRPRLIQTTCELVFLGPLARFRFLRRIIKKLLRMTGRYKN